MTTGDDPVRILKLLLGAFVLLVAVAQPRSLWACPT
jgi:hypothetical protein